MSWKRRHQQPAALGATAIAFASHRRDLRRGATVPSTCAGATERHAHSGRVKKRANPTERVLALVCPRVRFDAYLRDMNVGVPASDGRRIEVLAQDLSRFGGAQLAVDTTLRSVLTRAGEPKRN